MRKYIAEIIGTYGLVFAGTGSVMVNAVRPGSLSLIGIATCFGVVVMAMIYAVGDVSGAHLNPAVTLGFFASRQLPGRYVIPYIASQLVGALLASLTLLLLLGNHASMGTTLPSNTQMQSLGMEITLTAILMFVILCVANGPKETGILAGIAIGGTVGIEVLIGGPISGASMNPARSLAPAIVSGNLHSLWIYLVGPIIGAMIAVPLWWLMRVDPGRKAVAVGSKQDNAPAARM